MPANVAAIAWQPGFDARSDGESRLQLPRFECTAADGSTREIRFSALPLDQPDHLLLGEPLIAGERCTLSSGISDCSVESDLDYLQGRAEFEIVPYTPLPETLGLLAVAGPNIEDVELAADGSCSEVVPACVARASVELSEAAQRWTGVLRYETYVDGERFSTARDLAVPSELGSLYNGRDADFVFAVIGDLPENVSTTRDLDPGEHTVEIRAYMPGTDRPISTSPVTINLDCGHRAQVPLARNEVQSGSDDCTVSPTLGSSQRHKALIPLAMLGTLLIAARRRARRRG